MSKETIVTRVIGNGEYAYLSMGDEEFLHSFGGHGFGVTDGPDGKGQIYSTRPNLHIMLGLINSLSRRESNIDWNSARAQAISVYCTDALSMTKNGRILLESRADSIDEFLSKICCEHKVTAPISIKSFIDKIKITKHDMLPDLDGLVGDGLGCYLNSYCIWILQRSNFVLIVRSGSLFTEYSFTIPDWLNFAFELGKTEDMSYTISQVVSDIAGAISALTGAHSMWGLHEIEGIGLDEIEGEYELRNKFNPFEYDSAILQFYCKGLSGTDIVKDNTDETGNSNGLSTLLGAANASSKN